MSFIRRLAIAAATLAPFAYLGMLLGVAIHEILGHGLTCIALGGQFIGFQLFLDGMGYAFLYLPEAADPWRHILVNAGGIAVTSIIGLPLFLAAFLLRRRPWAALPLSVLSFAVLMDGIPYLFWNAIKPVPPGDVASILTLAPSLPLRIALIFLGGILLLATIWAFTALTFTILRAWLSYETPLPPWFRPAVLLPLALIPGLLWLTFDWDQLVQGLGHIPNLTILALHLAAAASLWPINPPTIRLHTQTNPLRAALLGWSLALAALLTTALYLRNGVFFP